MRNFAVGVCVGLVLLGCSSFTSTPAATSPTDDAGTDASLDAGSGGDATDGAMPVDPGFVVLQRPYRAACAPTSRTGTSFGSWGVAEVAGVPTAGTIARDDTSGYDSRFGLHAALLAKQESGVSYALHASSGNRVFLEADVRIHTPVTGLDGSLTLLEIQLGDTSVSATIGTGATDDCIVRLYTTSTAFAPQDDAFVRVAYGQWARLRLESDLAGTGSDGNAHLTILRGGVGAPFGPGAQTALTRVTATNTPAMSVVGLVRSVTTAAKAAVEADFDNLVGGAF